MVDLLKSLELGLEFRVRMCRESLSCGKEINRGVVNGSCNCVGSSISCAAIFFSFTKIATPPDESCLSFLKTWKHVVGNLIFSFIFVRVLASAGIVSVSDKIERTKSVCMVFEACMRRLETR